MSLIPWWTKWVVLGIVLVALGVWFRVYQHQLREEGRDEIRAEWRAANDKAERVATAAARRAETDATARSLQVDKDFKLLRTKNAALSARLATACVDPVLVDRLRESVKASNRTSPGGTAPGAATPAGPPDGNQVDEWFSNVAQLYRQCREQVIGWIEWDDRRLAK